MAMRVGVIGLGVMGSALAEHLLRAAYPTCGYDVEPAARARFAALGGSARASAEQVAGDADCIILSLPSAAALAATVEALYAVAARGQVVIETSTLALDDKLAAQRRLAEVGIDMLDCPLSGTGAQARAGQVVVYASGDASACQRVAQLFEAFAARHFYLGAFGQGSRLKLVANLLVSIHNVAAAEALALVDRVGLDREQALTVLCAGAGTSRMLEVRGPAMLADHYRPAAMSVELFAKDLDIIGAFVAAHGATTPLFDVTRGLYRAARAAGFGADDTAVVRRLFDSPT